MVVRVVRPLVPVVEARGFLGDHRGGGGRVAGQHFGHYSSDTAAVCRPRSARQARGRSFGTVLPPLIGQSDAVLAFGLDGEQSTQGTVPRRAHTGPGVTCELRRLALGDPARGIRAELRNA
jgi:hypothetical protein